MVEAQLPCLATRLLKMIHGLLKVIHGKEVISKEKEEVDTTIGTAMVAVAAMEEVKSLLMMHLWWLLNTHNSMSAFYLDTTIYSRWIW